MITINSAPISGRILLDSNNTIVSVTSNNGLGYYFRALIYVDDVLHDTQGWSRKDNYTAEKDLKKLYNAYYESVFNSEFIAGLAQQTHLIKKISIAVQERNLSDDSLAQAVNLPDFFLMYNAGPVKFDDLLKVQFLGLEAPILQVSDKGKLSIPFMVNAASENLSVELSDNLGNIIDLADAGSITGTKAYLYQFSLSEFAIDNTALYLNLKIVIGASSISKTVRIMRLPDYPIKEIAYLNNFGYWIYAYLDGMLQIDSNYEASKYEQLDGTEKIYEINEGETYTINTGSLLGSEKELIRQICLALESKLFFTGVWIELLNAAKKINVFKDRNNNYSESLVFTLRKDASIPNMATEAPVYDQSLEMISAEIEVVETELSSGINIIIELKFNGIEPEDPITLILTKAGIDSIYTAPVYLNSFTSQYFVYYGLGGLDYPPGNYDVKLRLISDPLVESNVIPVVI